MGQLGFFDLNRRYESQAEKNDPFVAIAAMVPFESFLHASQKFEDVLDTSNTASDWWADTAPIAAMRSRKSSLRAV